MSRYIFIFFQCKKEIPICIIHLLIEWKVVKNKKKLYDPFPLKAICWKDNETITYSNNSTVAKMLSLVWKKNTRLTSLDNNVVHFFTKILEMAVVNISLISNSLVPLFSIFIQNWNGVISLNFEGILFWWNILFLKELSSTVSGASNLCQSRK